MKKTDFYIVSTVINNLAEFSEYEIPERISTIHERLVSTGLAVDCIPLSASPASRDDLARAHSNTYCDEIFDLGNGPDDL